MRRKIQEKCFIIWRAAVDIVIYVVTPSSETIKSPRKPYIPDTGHQGNQCNYDPLSHTDSRLDGRVEVIPGENIILLPD